MGINVYIDYILPHYPSREIIFGMDKYNNSINIESILSAMETNTIKSVKSNKLDNINWKILFILSNLGNVLGHNDYNGYIQRQLRQLKTIGYEPILVISKIILLYINSFFIINCILIWDSLNFYRLMKMNGFHILKMKK